MITLQIPEGDRCGGCMFLDAGADGKGNFVEGFPYKWASCVLFENLMLIGEYDSGHNTIGYCKHKACRRVVEKAGNHPAHACKNCNDARGEEGRTG